MKVRSSILLAAVAFCGLGGSAVRAANIAIDFVGGNTAAPNPSQMTSTEVAGAVPQANWNSFTGATQATQQALVLNNGSASGAFVTWDSNTGGTWDTGAGGQTDTAGDRRMMLGYLDTGDATTTTITVSGLPASVTTGGYNVFVYYDGDNGGNNRVGQYTIAGATTGNGTLYGRDAEDTTFGGTYTAGQSAVAPVPATLDNNNVGALTVPAGNFLVFTGVTGSGFTLTAQASAAEDATNRAPINGIQIVQIPEPASAGLLGLAGLGLLARRRRTA